jgi:hypothetical protein
MDHLYVSLGHTEIPHGQLHLLDLTGKTVMTLDVQPGIGFYEMNISHLPRGIYMLFWLDNHRVRGKEKIVLIR